MPFAVKLSEATAERRRMPVYLVDATDRISPETGILAPTIEWSKNGGGQNAGAGNWGEVGDGLYYYEFTAGEIDTLGGGHTLRVVKAGVSAEFVDTVVVTAYDPYSSTNLGLSYLSGGVALDSTVSKAAGTKGTDEIHDDLVTLDGVVSKKSGTKGTDNIFDGMATQANLNTKIPTALSFTGANVNAESKVTAAPADMALNSTVSKDSTVAKQAGTKGLDDVHDTMATEANLNTKIPTALSFTGANVNAESKVTAAPTDMAKDSTVAKGSNNAYSKGGGPVRMISYGTTRNCMIFVTDSTTRLGKTGLVSGNFTFYYSKNGGDFAEYGPVTVNEKGYGWYMFAIGNPFQTTVGDLAFHVVIAGADPLDFTIPITAFDPQNGDDLGCWEIDNINSSMALDSTVAKEATLNTKIPTALSFTGANVNAESKVTAPPTDMALNSTVAKDGTVAKAAGTKGTDATYDEVMTHPTLTEIEASTILAKQVDLIRALGLMQENQYIDQVVYTSGKVTSMRLRTYDSAVNVGTGTGVVATYTITAQYTVNSLDWFKAVKS